MQRTLKTDIEIVEDNALTEQQLTKEAQDRLQTRPSMGLLAYLDIKLRENEHDEKIAGHIDAHIRIAATAQNIKKMLQNSKKSEAKKAILNKIDELYRNMVKTVKNKSYPAEYCNSGFLNALNGYLDKIKLQYAQLYISPCWWRSAPMPEFELDAKQLRRP